MLNSTLGYLAGAGISTRWVVIEGDDEFFDVTKGLHHLLHGEPGNGTSIEDSDRPVYERCTATASRDLLDLVRPGDPVILHDPQTLGLLPALANRGLRSSGAATSAPIVPTT